MTVARKKAAKYRKLLDGSRGKEIDGLTEWVFQSKCPDKWLHIDLESGHVYVAGLKKIWKKPERNQIRAAWIALDDERRRMRRR